MGIITTFIDLILHLDTHLDWLVQTYGLWTYAVLFLILFLETGFVITPFLPGDSLLFAAGAIAARGSLEIQILFIILFLAAVTGDVVNYTIGKLIGPKIFRQENVRFFNKEHLRRTQAFYDKYGGKTIILARFIPIIRTFAPFVAGIGSMRYWRFAMYNILGGFLWITLFLIGGYYFGSLTIVKNNFSLVILLIIVISLIPVGIEFLKHYRKKHQPQF